MSALRSGIEELANQDVADCTYGELTDAVAEISRAIDMLTYQLATRLYQVDRRGQYRSYGHLSPTRWLARITDLDSRVCTRLVSMGRALAEFPKTAERFATGQMSRSRARVLCRAARKHPEAYRRDEEMLLQFASDMSVWD